MSETVVAFKSLGTVAELFARDGEGAVEAGDSAPSLKGSFSLRLHMLGTDILSNPVKFGAGGIAASAKRTANGWELISLPRLAFNFPAAARVRRGPRDPLMVFSRVICVQPQSEQAPALISLDDLSISLAPAKDPSGIRQYVFPTRNGWGEAGLTILSHPQVPQATGFFLRTLDDGSTGVVAGGPGGGVNLDHAEVVFVSVSDQCNLVFRLLDSQGAVDGAMLLSAAEANDLAVVVDSRSELVLQRDAPGLGGMSRSALASLEARDGMLSAPSFVDDEVMLRRAVGGAASESFAGNQTLLLGTPDRFSLHLEIPHDSNFDPSQHTAEFRYEESASASFALADPQSRFHGLRIADVYSTRGRQEIFDTSLARVRLMRVEGNAAFHFEAGGALEVGGESKVSIVVPKPDPSAGGRRSVAIATQALVVRLDTKIPDFAGMTVARDPGESVLVLRTAENRLDLVKPVLAGPPAGLTATTSAAKSGFSTSATAKTRQTLGAYGDWELRLPDNAEQSLKLTATDSGLAPPPRWVEPFVTVSRKFELLEQPGSGIELKGKGPSESPLPFPEGTRTELVFEKPGSTKQLLVYSAAAIAAAMYPLRKELLAKLDEYRREGEAFIDTMKLQIGYQFAKLTAEELAKYVKSREVDALLFGFSSTGPTDPANRYIAQFIDANIPEKKEGEKPVRKLYMPFDVGLSVTLVDFADVPAQKQYAHDIMHTRALADPDIPPDKRPRPGMLFDFSKRQKTPPEMLGWTADDWGRLAREQPSLWPRLSGAAGARLDPSDDTWVGLMMRDLPAGFAIPPELKAAIEKKSPVLGKFYDALNNNLQLAYGWIDATGPTWYITLGKPTGYDFTPESWKDFLTFRLERVGIAGAGGKPAGAEGKLSLSLNRIKNSQDKAVTIEGRFGLDITRPDPITVIELTVDAPAGLDTNAIPGFEKITLTGLTTDLVSANVRMELMPSAALSSAVPIFRSDAPTPASLVLNFSGSSQSAVQLSIPTDRDTNLFGRFPLTIQGIYLQFGVKGGDTRNKLLIRGRLGLGLPGLEAVGADLILRQTGSGFDFDVQINEIDVALSLGDSFRLAGLLSWAPDDVDIDELHKPGGFRQPLSGPKLPDEGAKRNFWAVLSLKTGSFMGDLDVLMKIGTQGERTFWVGAARSSMPINLGSARFESPGIVFAHNADFTDGGGLRKFVTNPFANLVEAIRPPDGDPDDPSKDLKAKRDWLKRWGPSSDIGAVVAGSGYLHLADVVAESPKADGPKFLTALIASDCGLFRLDAQTKFMKAKIIGFGVAIDTRQKRIMAAIRAPRIAVPDEASPQYVISPGTMSIGLSYDRDKLFFSLGIGWPPLVNGSDFERDWSQSTQVYIAELVPINTFWGGYRAELDVPNKKIRFGYAIRAGWTWKAELNGADIAKASAELGIAVGGVIEFLISWSRDPQPMSSLVALPHPMLDSPIATARPLALLSVDTVNQLHGDNSVHLLAALEIMDAATGLEMPDIEVAATLYGDIWGKGSVEFLGVTLASIEVALRLRLQVCGGLKRGLTRVYGRGEIEVHVTILCVHFTGHAGFDLWVKRGDCLHGNLSALFAPLPVDALPFIQAPVAAAAAPGVNLQ